MAQTALQQEAIRCLECKAFRAAIVTGWNMAYDYIRQWAFDLHLAAFNNRLTAHYVQRNGTPQYDPIADYRDFFDSQAPGERIVLDVLQLERLIGGRLHGDLCKYLRDRNEVAHATGKSPTATQANAYIEHLIDILVGKPFN
jgi:hypothetical protein